MSLRLTTFCLMTFRLMMFCLMAFWLTTLGDMLGPFFRPKWGLGLVYCKCQLWFSGPYGLANPCWDVNQLLFKFPLKTLMLSADLHDFISSDLPGFHFWRLPVNKVWSEREEKWRKHLSLSLSVLSPLSSFDWNIKERKTRRIVFLVKATFRQVFFP
jgi:hypothetical protein